MPCRQFMITAAASHWVGGETPSWRVGNRPSYEQAGRGSTRRECKHDEDAGLGCLSLASPSPLPMPCTPAAHPCSQCWPCWSPKLVPEHPNMHVYGEVVDASVRAQLKVLCMPRRSDTCSVNKTRASTFSIRVAGPHIYTGLHATGHGEQANTCHLPRKTAIAASCFLTALPDKALLLCQ